MTGESDFAKRLKVADVGRNLLAALGFCPSEATSEAARFIYVNQVFSPMSPSP